MGLFNENEHEIRARIKKTAPRKVETKTFVSYTIGPTPFKGGRATGKLIFDEFGQLVF